LGLSFLIKYENKKTKKLIIWFFWVLDLKFKNHFVISSFIGREQGVALVEEYDKKSLYLMLVKCHEHLYPLVNSNRNYANQDIFDQDRIAV
jgi:hypothetical protein